MLKRGSKDWDRFWSKVKRGPGCWEWQASCRDGRYGQFNINGRMRTAHRIVRELGHGPIPKRMCVCHTCDNTKCVRPSHLFLGTHRDNMKDARIKGRIAKGTNHHYSKLTEEQVKEIRKDTRVLKHIAKEHDVSISQVCKIKQRESWKHVT